MTTPLPALGIDMAKSTFDVHLLTDMAASSHHFVNTPQGFAALAQWLKQRGIERVHACMEATGTYGDAAFSLFVSGCSYRECGQSCAGGSLSALGGRANEDRQARCEADRALLCARSVPLPGFLPLKN